MAERTPDWNPPDELTDEWIAHVDAIYPSPVEQANTILEQLHDPHEHTWALIFFAVEVLGNIARPMFGAGTPLAQKINSIGRDLYGLHYFHAPDLYDLQRVAPEEVDDNGILPIAQANQQSPDISEPGPDGPNSSS